MGSSVTKWTTPADVAKREARTPRKALAETSGIARFSVNRQRADDGAQSSEEDGNARRKPPSSRR
jgi:hypothetical protein